MKYDYELALVIHPRLEVKQRDELLELVEKMIKQFGGGVTSREDGGKKMLAYPIKKMNEGWYFFLNFDLPFDAVSKLDMKLNMEEDILRYLILRMNDYMRQRKMKSNRKVNKKDKVKKDKEKEEK